MNIVAGIAGIRPYQPGRDGVDLLRSALRRYATGPCSTVVRGGVILAVASTFDDAPVLPQPYQSPCGMLLAFDGRMDQVEGHELMAPDTDTNTLGRIAASYEARGIGMFEHLTGDYGLVLYEEQTGRLLMARDFVGAKHLFYVRTKVAIYFASKLTVLLHLAPVSVDPDMHYIAQFFAGTVDTGRSPYREIASVRSGACMSVDLRDGSTEEHPYWFAHTVPPLRYACAEEYNEHFRQVFQQSVRRRMRSPRRVLADLSGGLDSSSIVCMADRVSAQTAGPKVETWTRAYSDAPMEDESTYVEAIQEHRTKSTNWVRDSAGRLFEMDSLPDCIVAPCGWYYTPSTVLALNGVLSDLKSEAHLCGYGGDQVMWNIDPGLSPLAIDRIASARLFSAWFQLNHLSKKLNLPLVSLIRTHLSFWRRIRGSRKRGLRKHDSAEIFTSRFLLSYSESAVAKNEMAHARFGTFGQRIQARQIDEARSVVHAGIYPEEVRSDRRFPFLDRDLNEYLLAIPAEVKKHPGETRSLLRRSLTHIVPPKVLCRSTKGIIDVTLSRNSSDFIRSVTGENWILEDLDVIAPATWRSVMNRSSHGAELRLGSVIRAMAIEIWLRRRPIGFVGSRNPISPNQVLRLSTSKTHAVSKR